MGHNLAHYRKYTTMSFIVTCRYDYNSPLELAKILEFLRKFDDVIGCLELMSEGEKKDHLHARISHSLNPMSFGRLLKKICPFLTRSKKGHHWLLKEGKNCCDREKHNPPHLPEKCASYGSFCYVLKSGNYVLNKGHTTEKIEEWINIGSTIKSATKLILYQKIISYSKLKRLASMEEITYALKKYYNEVRGVPLPHWTNRILILTMDQIVFELKPKLAAQNLKKLQEEAQQRYL